VNPSNHEKRNSGRQLRVVIGACTYRRPRELERLLIGVARQEFKQIDPPAFEVLIVDNEGSLEAEAVCSTFSRRWPNIPMTYVIEQTRGISEARNTVLDNLPSKCDFLVMIDDDECPGSTWLENLLATQATTNADIVRGPVIARYSDSAPEWVVEGGYFGWPDPGANFHDGQPMTSASTGNTLVRATAVRESGVRFNAELSLSGGEDSVFFSKLIEHGCRIVYSRLAAVEEFIPPERTGFSALLRLSYRSGNNRLLKFLRMSHVNGKPGRVAGFILMQLLRGFRDLTVGSLRMLGFWLPGRKGLGRLYSGLLQTAKGAGQLTGLLGIRYQYYR